MGNELINLIEDWINTKGRDYYADSIDLNWCEDYFEDRNNIDESDLYKWFLKDNPTIKDNKELKETFIDIINDDNLINEWFKEECDSYDSDPEGDYGDEQYAQRVGK